MAVTIQLPASMRRFMGDQERIEVEAGTVGEALEALCGRCEALREKLLKPNGKARPSVTLFVNNRQPAAKPDTDLSDGDTLVVLQPVGGG